MPLWKSASDGLAEQTHTFAIYTLTRNALIQVVQLVVETDKKCCFLHKGRGMVWFNAANTPLRQAPNQP